MRFTRISSLTVILALLSLFSNFAWADADVFVKITSGKNVSRIPKTPIDYNQPVNGVVTGDWRDAMTFGGTVTIIFGNEGNKDAEKVEYRLAIRTMSDHSKHALVRAPECTISNTGKVLPTTLDHNSDGEEIWIVDFATYGNEVLRANHLDDIRLDCEVSIPDCSASDVFAVPLISTASSESDTSDNGDVLPKPLSVDQFGWGSAVTVSRPTLRYVKYADVPRHNNDHVVQPFGNWPGYTRCDKSNPSYGTGDYFECYFVLKNSNRYILSNIQVDDWGISVAKLNPGFPTLAAVPPGGLGFSKAAKFAWSIVNPAISVNPDGYGGYKSLLAAGFHGVDSQERDKMYNRFCVQSGIDLCAIPQTSPRKFGSFFPSNPKNISTQNAYLETIALDVSASPSYQKGLPKCLFPGEEIRYRTMADGVGLGVGNSGAGSKMTMTYFMKFNGMSTPYGQNRVYLPPEHVRPWRPQ